MENNDFKAQCAASVAFLTMGVSFFSGPAVEVFEELSAPGDWSVSGGHEADFAFSSFEATPEVSDFPAKSADMMRCLAVEEDLRLGLNDTVSKEWKFAVESRTSEAVRIEKLKESIPCPPKEALLKQRWG
mmetsp:Transcript_20978/g.45492  ORF Transcript_20978/g.45492 Transcript_20978/m.45492 type:complete len:130 (+) Transcript_20978:2527-2916(+)